MSLLPRHRHVWCALVMAIVFVCACGGSKQAEVRSPATAGHGDKAGHAADVGDAPPPFSLRSLDGSALALPRGKVMVLVFWATWSEPDKKELIKLQELYARVGAERLGVIALSIDDEPTLLPEFAKTYGLRFPIAWDSGHRVASVYAPASDPTTYVIDRAGIIRFVHRGYHDGEADVIASEVESL